MKNFISFSSIYSQLISMCEYYSLEKKFGKFSCDYFNLRITIERKKNVSKVR